MLESVVAAIVGMISSIGSVIATIISAIHAALSAVGSALAGILSSIGGELSGVLTAIGGGLANAVAGIARGVAGVVTNLPRIVGTTWRYLKAGVQALEAHFKSFLEFIHFDTILSIHNIAFIISPHYRQAVNNLYRELSKVARAIGAAPQFINLAIRNARNVVLDVSSMFGRKYDLAEVEWIETLDDFLRQVADKADRYAREPWELFNDIDEMIVKPHVDAKAAGQRTILGTIRNVVDATGRLVDDLVTLRNDIDQFIRDLPTSVRREVEPMLRPVIDRFDAIIYEHVEPSIRRIDDLLNVVSGRQAEIRGDVDRILDRISRPDRYIQEVDQLPPDERVKAEVIIHDIVHRPIDREIAALHEEMRETVKELEAVAKVYRLEIPPPAWYVGEAESPRPVPQTKIEPRETWFVGDY